MSDQPVLHVKGRVLVGPEDIRDELWVIDGRISYDRPPAPVTSGRSTAGPCPAWSTPTAT
jgi:hypothetical protein